MRFGLLDDALQTRIVGARAPIQAAMHGPDNGDVEPYDPARISPRATVLDNVLFGRIDIARMHGESIIQREVRAVFREFDLEGIIQRRGLEQPVGNRGGLMTERVRVRLGLSRALLRRPEILAVDRVDEHLDGGAQTLIDVVGALLPEASLVASVSGRAALEKFPARLAVEPAEARLRAAAE